MRRPFGVLLVVSLLVNVFTVGAIGGGFVMLLQQNGWRPHLVVSPHPIPAAGEGLPAADRKRFRQTIRQVFQHSRDLSQMARDSREAAAALFVQPQFDITAVSAALAHARAADFELRVRLETAAITFAAGLPESERAVLAEGLARGGPLRHPARAGNHAN